jgi:hypothetical protein
MTQTYTAEMPSSTRRNPFIFIVGCPRSGTTLLQRIVDAHSQIAMTPETHWIPTFFEDRDCTTADGRVLPAIVARLAQYRTFPRLDIDESELAGLLDSRENPSYADFVADLFDLYGNLRGKRLVGDKTPGYVRCIRLLHSLWPHAKFVHLIRDGRDVCLSAMNWRRKIGKLAERFTTWNEDPVSTAALWWEWHVRLGQEAGRLLGPEHYREVRYECLVRSPAEECAALARFLQIPFEEQMLSFHIGRTSARPGLDAKHAWLPITPGLRDWRTQMPAEQIERFEAAAGDLLDELELERAFRSPRPEAQRHAERMRRLFPKKFAAGATS